MISNATIIWSLTQYIKKNPEKLIECSTKLAERLIQRSPINLDTGDLEKISLVYQFIIMYSILTSDLNLVIKLLYSISKTKKIIESIKSGSLKTTREPQLSLELLNFTKKNAVVLLDDQNLSLAELYFNKVTYFEVVKIVHDSYLPHQ
ncbi:MAG: hypothetical protein K2Y14_03010 [Burkholderiales bacterium]|nr:hypothetical protein [Burkholderiales bacterium]